MNKNHVPSRPCVQGISAPLHLRGQDATLTDGVGLEALRRLWDVLDLGHWIARRTGSLPGVYCPTLMVELWPALLVYGGGWLDELKWLRRRQIRRLFGWMAAPDPTTFGRWLRRCGTALTPVLDELVWHLVRVRWRWTRVPRAVTVVVDSTVILRYGPKQAGAEVGYNPKKPGRPSHHPLVAFLQETGDLVGLQGGVPVRRTRRRAPWSGSSSSWRDPGKPECRRSRSEPTRDSSRKSCPADWIGWGSPASSRHPTTASSGTIGNAGG